MREGRIERSQKCLHCVERLIKHTQENDDAQHGHDAVAKKRKDKTIDNELIIEHAADGWLRGYRSSREGGVICLRWQHNESRHQHKDYTDDSCCMCRGWELGDKHHYMARTN